MKRGHLHISIYGEPVPEGRHRFRVIQPAKSKKAYAQVYTPAETRDWKSVVEGAVAERMCRAGIKGGWDGPIALSIMTFITRPKSVKIEKRPLPIVKPDTDNFLKGVMDGITQAGLWTDDARVTDLSIGKRYADQRIPGVEVEVQELDPGNSAWLELDHQ
jgi:Holliday junction resolvase RusA-like endonuclease